ncbi:MAG: hypothetical protein ACYDBB_05175 [Armatimonadota bacterium]
MGKVIAWILYYGCLFIASTIVAYASVKKIRMLGSIIQVFSSKIPKDALLDCRDKTVTVDVADRTTGIKRSIDLYTGLVTWNGGRKTVDEVLNMAQSTYRKRIAVFILIVLPVTALFVYMAMHDPSKKTISLIALGVIVVEQFYPFSIIPDA